MAPESTDPYEAGRQAWPTIALEEALFARALGDGGGESVHAADLYLACAAAHCIGEAVAAFERQYMSRVPQFVGHMNLPAHAVDELCQRLREGLLLGRGGQPPKLAEYAGRGPLGAWLRVVAVRAALDQLRSDQGRATDTLESELPFLDGGGDEPELQLLRTRFRPRFVEALRAAAATLTARERNLLRLSLVDGMTLDQIAPLFRVTKSTVHRWIEKGRRHFLREVRRFFREQMGLSASELDSVARLLQSQVDFSLPSLLRTK
jgi:RNA polymerase sigma-70 factor, ECF subfamily